MFVKHYVEIYPLLMFITLCLYRIPRRFYLFFVVVNGMIGSHLTLLKENDMNKDQVEGKWEQLKGEIKKTWGNLSDDELAYYNGNRQKFLGIVQEKYGIAQEQAEKRLAELEKNCGCSSK